MRSVVVESASFAYEGTELSALAEAQNYYRWVINQFAPFLGKRVIEVGAGIGTFARSLLNDTPLSELVLVEPGDNLFPLLQRRFAGESRVKIVHGYFQRLAIPPAADSIVLVNVLEHQAFAGGQTTRRGLRNNPPVLLESSRHRWLVSGRQGSQADDVEVSICAFV
jgi:Ribosomal RNA adenine dimethylase